MNSNRRIAAIGIDVGGTKIAGGVVWWPSGEVQFPCSVPTLAAQGGEAVLSSTIELIRSLMGLAQEHAIPIRGAGVGVAELVDAEGNVTSSQTIRWADLPVQRLLSDLCPARLESDVRAAASAEAVFGAGRPFKSFVYITVGTGISSCFVLDGRPLPGARGNALVMASSPLSTVCTACGEELHPVLEQFASGPAIAARYHKHLCASERTGSCAEPCSTESVFHAASEGSTGAAEILRSAGAALGVSVAFLVNVLDPDAVVVGGGLGLARGLYWESFVESARQHIWSPATRSLPFLQAGLGTHSGVIGAAARVLAPEHNLQRGKHSA